MKIPFGFILVFAIAVGCSASQKQNVIIPADVDFDTAIEIIATSNDWSYVNTAQARLSYGGLPAIEALRNHLSDDRVIPTGYSTRAINSGDVTIGQQAFWTIQDIVEIRLAKSIDNYSAFTPESIENWLDQHQGKSLLGLQIEAASDSLIDAKRDLAETGNSYARQACDSYTQHLSDLYSQN